MKKRYYFLGFLFFLTYGCCFPFCFGDGGCLEYDSSPDDWPPKHRPKTEKTFTIINHTDKKYKDNFLDIVCAKKSESDGTWKLYYENRKIKIEPNENILRIDELSGCLDRVIIDFDFDYVDVFFSKKKKTYFCFL